MTGESFIYTTVYTKAMYKKLRYCERCSIIRVHELKCLRCIYRIDEGVWNE